MSMASLAITDTGRQRRAVAQPAGSLATFFSEIKPDWHSQWAWDRYEATILGLAHQFGLRSVCEIGGGRDPLFTQEQAARNGIDLIVNDIDAGELALTGRGLKTARFDIAGDLSEPDVRRGGYDMMVSRMVFEHVDGVERAWHKIGRAHV